MTDETRLRVAVLMWQSRLICQLIKLQAPQFVIDRQVALIEGTLEKLDPSAPISPAEHN